MQEENHLKQTEINTINQKQYKTKQYKNAMKIN